MTTYNSDDIMQSIENLDNYISNLSTKLTKLEGILENMSKKIDLIENREFTRDHWQRSNPDQTEMWEDNWEEVK